MCVYTHISFNVILHIFIFFLCQLLAGNVPVEIADEIVDKIDGVAAEAMDGDNLFILATIK